MTKNSLTLRPLFADVIGAGRYKPGHYGQTLRVFAIFLPTILCLAAYFQPFVEKRWLFLDPVTSIELSGECCSVYFGLFSNIGVLAWTSASAICLFAFFLLMVHTQKPGVKAAFAFIAALLSGWFALDDAFLLHEKVLPALGMPQEAVIAVYVASGIFYCVFALRLARFIDVYFLLVALGFLAASVGIDQFFHSVSNETVFFEDSAKFIGIVCWAAFHAECMFNFLAAKFEKRPELV